MKGSPARLALARIGTIRRAYLAAKFRRLFREFTRLASTSERFELRWADRMPRLDDATETTPFDRHYVYHVGWAARALAELKPALHVDIGSSLYFASITSAYIPMEFYDYRRPDLEMDGLGVASADLLALPFEDGSLESLSCLHVLEHVGLGRYGEPLSADADLEAATELARVVAPGGALLVVVPVGRPRIAFNAHRVYGFEQIIQMFPSFELLEFALIPDTAEEGGLLRNASPELVAMQTYGCGCFWFGKSSPS
jgi:SAM-dependent methyltransferase